MYEIHEVATTSLFDHDLFEKGDFCVRLYHINQSVVDESAGLSMARTDLLTCLSI